MANKKTSLAPVRVRVLISFNDVQKGDEADLYGLNDLVQGWVNAGLVEVLNGPDPAGSSGAEQDDNERVQGGAEGSLPAGGEPGEGFGSGGYGAPA